MHTMYCDELNMFMRFMVLLFQRLNVDLIVSRRRFKLSTNKCICLTFRMRRLFPLIIKYSVNLSDKLSLDLDEK